jgi:phytoene dehydrogenase-like protein
VPNAVVIGAGPNGLVAANLLADAGWSVHVLEAQPEPGGAVRSAELTEPGFVHDCFSSFYPLAAASPALRGLELERHGLEWCHTPLALAHPSADGTCAALSRDVEETCASLDSFAPGDGDAWRELYALWEEVREPLLDAIVTPFPPLDAVLRLPRRRLATLARVGLSPVETLARRRFRGDGAARLLTGNALHADLGPGSPLGGGFAWLLCMLGQDVGFPFPRGGAGRLTDALVRRLEARGGRLTCGARVEQVLVRDGRAVGVRLEGGEEIGAARALLADVAAPALYLRLLPREHVPARMLAGMRRFVWDPATVKAVWALDAPIPWSAPDARRAGVVHVAEGVGELSAWAGALQRGRVPADPFVILGQYAAGDPTRAPAGKETAWVYTRVPQGTPVDAERVVERIEERVEALAPGFRTLVRGRHVMGPAELERADENLVGGAINGGTARLRQQLVLRPPGGFGRPETGIAGLYLASASAHPGGGVHGGPGAIAARIALKSASQTRPSGKAGRAS